MTEIINLDTELLLWINGMHTPFLDQFMWLISGKAVWIPFYVITLWVVYRNVGSRKTIEMLIVIGIMMLFTDIINASVIRPLIHRFRPANLNSPIGSIVHIVNDYRGGRYGFPSAHAANYFGLTLIIAYFMNSRKVLYSLMATTMIVCYSRSYLGVHYPGDLIGGMLYATVVVGILLYCHNRYFPLPHRKEPVMEWLPACTAIITLIAFSIISLIAIQ